VFRARRPTFLMFFSSSFFTLTHSLTHSLTQARFWQQANLYVFVFAGIGASVVQTCVQLQKLTLKVCVEDSLVEQQQQQQQQQQKKGGHRSTHTHAAMGKGASTGKAAYYSLMVLKALMVIYCALQCGLRFRMNDHSGDWIFFRSGEALLTSMPRDSLLLLNGDLNNNMAKYVHQCERVRTDVHLVQLQLISWPWFVPLQTGMTRDTQRGYARGHKYKLKELLRDGFDMSRSNYPGIIFPGIVYHPRNPAGGFSMREFLDFNQFVYDGAGHKLKPRHIFKVWTCICACVLMPLLEYMWCA
jgi:hypothetical protein